jgi:hypothetical protein
VEPLSPIFLPLNILANLLIDERNQRRIKNELAFNQA